MPKSFRASFDGGELGPELFGRIDLAKYQSGLKKCQNFIIRPHGAAINRAGFEFVKEVKDSTKRTVLYEFIYSPTQAYIMEFGENYIRFHTEGGTILEAAKSVTGATSANPPVISVAAHGYSNGDEVYVDSLPGDFAVLNGRFLRVANVAAGTFELQDEEGNNIDASGFAAYTAGGTVARPVEVTTTYAEADLLELDLSQSTDTVTIAHVDYDTKELTRVSETSWTFTSATFNPGIAAPTGVAATATVGTGSTTYNYVVTALSANGIEESLASAEANCTNDLSTAGNYNTITGNNVSGAIRYNVYKEASGIFGYIGQTDDLTAGFKDQNIGADLLSSPPINQTLFSGAGNRPGAVCNFAQRRVYAGSSNAPQTTWMSRPGAVSNFTYHVPAQDDDSITFTLDARQANQILHLVPLTDLLELTNTGEWRVSSSDVGVITPSSLSARQQGYYGSATPPPIIAGTDVLYIRAQGSHVAALKYVLDKNAYTSQDLSLYAPHLVDNYTIDDWTFQKAPHPMAWAVRSDGALLGMTYLPEENITPWHWHTTRDEAFESVAAIPESTNEDMVYVVVNRTINGTTRRYIERMHVRNFTTVEDAFFVDSGLSYSGAATDTITGLWHLEGESVVALADGDVVPAMTVTNGSVTLPNEASEVHVGLAITADIETLPLAMQAEALSQGQYENISKAYMRINDSRGILAGPDEDHLRELAMRTSEAWGDPITLKTGEESLLLDGLWNADGGVLIRQVDPLPLSILSITLEVAEGG